MNSNNKLSYNEFKELCRSEIAARLGSGHQVTLVQIYKNNSVCLDGIVIRQSGAPLGPNLYLNDEYEAYLDGKEAETIIKELILSYYTFLKTAELPKEGLSFEFGQIREKIIYCLAARESNRHILEQCPHIPYLDFAILFQCLITADDTGIGTVRITNEHMAYWNTSLPELYACAAGNTARLLPPRLFPMSDLLVYAASSPMYVLTNTFGLQGASCILYDGILKEFAKKTGSGFFLLPSSIHEFLLLPSSGTCFGPDSDRKLQEEKDALSAIVREINSTRLKPEDVLTNHAYYYDPDTDTIR